MNQELIITLRKPHENQKLFIESKAKRKVVRAGRRGGKTVGASIYAVQEFLKGKRVLYAVPTEDQVGAFWFEVKKALANPIDAGIFIKNETMHTIEFPNTKQRIRAKTAFNSDTLRGDYADSLILDEFQLMAEDAWEYVGAPMLLDNDGDAVFIYTPPSLRSRSMSKAIDPLHAMKMYKKAEADTSGRWKAFHFTSHDNPYISKKALSEICLDMTVLAMRQEIEAEDIEEIPGALWKQKMIDDTREPAPEQLKRIVVGVDPQGKKKQYSETGIVVDGKDFKDHYFVLADRSINGTPKEWGSAAVKAYYDFKADRIVAEVNYGGDMVKEVIENIDKTVPVTLVSASRGKLIRAEPISALYERGLCHHTEVFPALEEEMISYTPDSDFSPNRMDGHVWAMTELNGITLEGWGNMFDAKVRES